MANEPEPGIHKGIPFDEYLSWRLLSHSVLKEPSPLHMKAAMDGKLEVNSNDTRLGSAIHCYLLDSREEYERRFPVAAPCSAILKSGARKGDQCGLTSTHRDPKGAWFCGKHCNGAAPVENRVSPDEHERVVAIAEKIDSHPVGRQLRAQGENELSLVAQVEDVLMKGRADRIVTAPGHECIIDFKKIGLRDGTQDNLVRKISKFGYDVQAYVYRRLYQEITGTTPGYMWLFVEDQYPYDLVPKQADDVMFALGKLKFYKRFLDWKSAVETGAYYGCGGAHTDEPDYIGPASWEAQLVA